MLLQWPNCFKLFNNQSREKVDFTVHFYPLNQFFKGTCNHSRTVFKLHHLGGTDPLENTVQFNVVLKVLLEKIIERVTCDGR